MPPLPDIPITQATLRAAKRDPRHWQPGHPERQGYADWVARGYDALEASSLRTAEGGGVAFVRA